MKLCGDEKTLLQPGQTKVARMGCVCRKDLVRSDSSGVGGTYQFDVALESSLGPELLTTETASSIVLVRGVGLVEGLVLAALEVHVANSAEMMILRIFELVKPHLLLGVEVGETLRIGALEALAGGYLLSGHC